MSCWGCWENGRKKDFLNNPKRRAIIDFFKKHLPFFRIIVVIKSYCHLLFLSQKSILVMKTALFKLLNQTIIPRYAAKLQYKIPK
ncbi:hypothetical protein HMPREF1396_00621 [Helicobacter pylori GAM114Ai]|nr:hypothetical protein HMPREF1396_00621 [Helicobacter pylori GAM114Ai]